MFVLWSDSLLIWVASHWHGHFRNGIRNEVGGKAKRKQDPFTAFTTCQHLRFIKSHYGIEEVVSPESDFKSNEVLSALVLYD